jgi:hypothetical protein
MAELGDILIQPYVCDHSLFVLLNYVSRFSHNNETVSPGYYSVLLLNYSIFVGYHFPPENIDIQAAYDAMLVVAILRSAVSNITASGNSSPLRRPTTP